jgi:hypothetical protein
MRTFFDAIGPNGWKGKWVAGFAGKNAGGGRNALVYLMRIEYAFSSHMDLWNSPAISEKTKMSKAADKSPLGDLYCPKQVTAGGRFKPASYVPPCRNHVHAPKKWHDDISYRGCSRRHASLLVGEPRLSFLWRRPMIFHESPIHRGQKKYTVDRLLKHLE